MEDDEQDEWRMVCRVEEGVPAGRRVEGGVEEGELSRGRGGGGEVGGEELKWVGVG